MSKTTRGRRYASPNIGNSNFKSGIPFGGRSPPNTKHLGIPHLFRKDLVMDLYLHGLTDLVYNLYSIYYILIVISQGEFKRAERYPRKNRRRFTDHSSPHLSENAEKYL